MNEGEPKEITYKKGYERYFREGYDGVINCQVFSSLENPYPIFDKNWSEEGKEKYYHWAKGFYAACQYLEKLSRKDIERERHEIEENEKLIKSKSAKQRKAETKGQSALF